MTIDNIDISLRISIKEVQHLSSLCDTPEYLHLLTDALASPDKRTANNAAWIITHISDLALSYLLPMKDRLIDMTLSATSPTLCRLLLDTLLRMPFDAEDIRTDFLNFCLNGITDTHLKPGTRSLCMKLAYRQCVHYPELLGELRSIHSMMQYDLLEPAMKSVHRNIGKRL
jgi:hypothetical protein